MRSEKTNLGSKKGARDIESQKFQTEIQKENLDLDRYLTIHEAKDLVSQGVAILDFDDDGKGKPKSVTVKRTLDNRIVFFSEEREDINKFLD